MVTSAPSSLSDANEDASEFPAADQDEPSSYRDAYDAVEPTAAKPAAGASRSRVEYAMPPPEPDAEPEHDPDVPAPSQPRRAVIRSRRPLSQPQPQWQSQSQAQAQAQRAVVPSDQDAAEDAANEEDHRAPPPPPPRRVPRAPPPPPPPAADASDDAPAAEEPSEAEVVDTSPCGTCGRKFNAASLARHEAVCQKVFLQKRAALNMAEQRTANLDLDNVEHEEKREQLVALNKSKQKWKKESNSFRDSLRAAREYQQAIAEGRDPPPPPTATVDDSLVPCPHCNRRFAEHTAQRHIPHCANTKARPKGPGKPQPVAAAAAAAPPKRR